VSAATKKLKNIYPVWRGRGHVHKRGRVRHVHNPHEYHQQRQCRNNGASGARDRICSREPGEYRHEGGHCKEESAAWAECALDAREEDQLESAIDYPKDTKEGPDLGGCQTQAAELCNLRMSI